MLKYLPATFGLAVLLTATTASAQERTALESASVKAATDCIAAVVLNNPDIVACIGKPAQSQPKRCGGIGTSC